MWAVLSLHAAKNNLPGMKYLPPSRGGRESGSVLREEEEEGRLFSRLQYSRIKHTGTQTAASRPDHVLQVIHTPCAI